jgi:Fic family protein
MKKPQNPPDSSHFNRLLTEDPARLCKIMNSVSEPLVDGKYLHWDQLRHRQPPTGFSCEEWWARLKFARIQNKKHLPLEDTKGQSFYHLVVDPIPARLHEIDLSAGGHIQVSKQITNPDTRDQYYVSSLIEEAIASSQLEGATTTRQIAKEMIRTKRKPQDRSERMILNNYLTMRKIEDIKDKPLSKNLIFEIHSVITEDTLDDPSAAGRFRTSEEKIVVGPGMTDEVFHEPPPADLLDERIDALCNFANEAGKGEFVHPVIRAIILHFWLAYEHPFVDGNGRTARALFYWLMARKNYWLFEFVSISATINKAHAKYARAFLYTETDDNDLTYFILYHLDVILKAIGELHKYIDRKTQRLRELEKELKGLSELNHRQRSLIGHALRHPHQQYTFYSHAQSHSVTHQTARTDLLDLKKRGYLKARKVGRQWFFEAVTGLENELAKGGEMGDGSA